MASIGGPKNLCSSGDLAEDLPRMPCRSATDRADTLRMEAALSSPRQVAPKVFEDGIGERLSAVGGANEALEVLKVSNELSAVSTFEGILREQTTRLGYFRHEAFARVRAVERLDSRTSTVVVISERVRGVRLSEVLATAERQGIPLTLNAALCLLRQLVAAVAAFHEAEPNSCHGAIAPERIVITPEGRLIVVEYVLGPALEELRFSQERYWRELGVAVPHRFGLPRFDLFADVTQMGAVALALVLGRRLAIDEYPTKISDVVDSAMTRLESGESEPIPVLLRAWIRSALQLEPRHSFVSAIGAKKDLDIALSHASPDAERASLRSFLTKYAAAVLADRSTEPPAQPSTVPVQLGSTPAPEPFAPVPALGVTAPPLPPVPPVTPAPPPAPTAGAVPVAATMPTPVAAMPTPPPVAPPVTPLQAVQGSSARPVAVPSPTASISTSPAVPPPAAPAAPLTTPAAKPAAQGSTPTAPPAESTRPIWMNPWAGAAAAAVLIIATLGFTLTRPGSVPPPATGNGTLTVGTSPEGATVFVDGVNRGLTPLNLSLSSGEHVLELVSNGERRRIPVTLTAGGQVSHYFDLPKTSPTGTGSLQVRTDRPGVKVTVDGQPFGRTPTVVTSLTPGLHQVLLESDTERVSEQVQIEEGVTASLVVPMKGNVPASGGSGWIAISAPAEVQIYENQRLLGTSRTDRIMVPAGRHDLELVNESLGFRGTRSVEVANGQVASIRPDWPRGTVALNALPWAEVFVNGERLGETPIGSASLPIGVHEIVFRHPELGERKASAIVTSGAPARLSVDMRAK